jgi:hypothetical protein
VNRGTDEVDHTAARRRTLAALMAVTAVAAGCTPTVQIAAPPEPITINLNIRIEHELRVRIDKELDDIISEDSGLF